MKTIGLIGGMSWESTVTYYKVINEYMKNQLGGHHSAKILMYSVEFEEIVQHQYNMQWDKSAEILGEIAQTLEKGGADFILICTNTMHKLFDEVQAKVSIPLIHIADATADELIKNNIDTVALLGTVFTMTQDFYKERLIQRGIKVVIPNEEEIKIVNDVIYNELCMGEIKETSRDKYKTIIKNLQEQGAQGVILGCTEIGLLIQQEHSPIPVFDTTLIHATKAGQEALK